MKKVTILAPLSALLIAHSAFAADTYVFDKLHSTIGFEIRHLFSKVPGKFTDFSGQIQLDEANPEQSSVEVTIETASVDTGVKMRDDDLRSPKFFDVKKFPEITFKSTAVKKTGENTADVTGNLIMHGVTKEVVLKVELLGKGAGPKNSTVSGWDASTALKRSDYGLTWNQIIEGTQMVGDDVQIELHVEADKK
ncbi:MAG: polyisoprenoid-binding protein [Verrucomicrobia bacterium]|jgi:polyisoprenoid-binding protein YceI|nr:polyisoprenoid-binding protein [Verrucomicrobiota bacterium]MBV8532359.1 polyisoprenoid-binding protein [Verrucomicrobiota bacterium]